MTGIEYLSIALLGEYDESQTADEIFAQIEAETKELIEEGEGILSITSKSHREELEYKVLQLQCKEAPMIYNWIGQLTIQALQLEDNIKSIKACIEHLLINAKERISDPQTPTFAWDPDRSVICMLSGYKSELRHNIERAEQAFRMLDLGFKESEKKNA